MNVENMKVLREALQGQVLVADGIGFNMRTEYDPVVMTEMGFELEDYSGKHCDAVACLAGWTVVVFEGSKVLREQLIPIMEEAKEILGIEDVRQYTELFMPRGYSDNPAQFTLARAIRVIDACIEAGTVPQGVWANVIQGKK